MLFPEEDSSLLKAWIVKRLENTSDADADVLADYVLALLHHDDGSEDVKTKCMTEMGNFLTEDPSAFVNDLFEVLQYKSYVPGALPPPKTISAVTPLPNLSGLGVPAVGKRAVPTDIGGGSARKRGFQDRDDFDAPIGRDQVQGGRSYKQPRRAGGLGGRKGYVDPDRPYPASEEHYTFQTTAAQHAPSFAHPGHMPQMPQFDMSNPLEAMRQLQQLSQQMGLSLAPFADYSPQQPSFQQNVILQQGRKGRCWDFDKKGFCPRGLKCKFDHSTGPEPMFSLPAPQLSGQIPLLNEEYDPTSATLSQPPQISQFPHEAVSYQDNGNFDQNRNNRPGQQRRKTGQARAPFSAEGPIYDRAHTKVVIESIPEENFDEEQVRNFFSQFGNVEEVTMMPYKRLAIVKYDNWGSANAAYKSPKVIFDNRFVKVYWYKDDKHGELANEGDGVDRPKNGHPANGVKLEDSADFKTEEIDMEELTRRQEEAQKAHEEKMAKLREIEKQREELEKRQRELQAKHAAEKQKLLQKLAGSRKNSTESDGGGGGGDAAGTDEKGGEAPKTAALKATLAKLRGEAAAMGIDPNVKLENDAILSTQYPPSYGRGGRGGYFRGRGAHASRGLFRGGGIRGGRGNLHAVYAQFSLDNRPRTVAISGVDFSAPENNEALRRHLFVLGGGSPEIQTTPTVTHLRFSDRKSAEAFYNSVKNKDLRIDDGPAVELSWVYGSAESLSGSTTSKVEVTGGEKENGGGGGGAGGGDDGLDSAMADANTTDNNNNNNNHNTTSVNHKAYQNSGGEGRGGQGQGQGQGQSQAQQQEPGEAKAEVDYDVAGDNEWDE